MDTALQPGTPAAWREAALDRGAPVVAWLRSPRRVRTALLRLTAWVAWIASFASAVPAQAPYRQEVMPGFSSLASGGYLQSPVLADLDADGDLDMLTGVVLGFTPGNWQLVFWENIGTAADPEFVSSSTWGGEFYPSWHSIYTLALADLDGDGDLDLVCGDPGNPIGYFKNIGSAGSPVFEVAIPNQSPFAGIDLDGNIYYPALVDLDGDGDLDLVVGQDDGTLRYFANTGSSTAPAFAEVTGAANPFFGIDYWGGIYPAFADLDSDGDVDLAARSDGVNYFLNIGTPTSPLFAAVTGSANPFNAVNPEIGFIGGGPAFGDLDGDGDLDSMYGQYEWIYFANTGTATSPTFSAVVGRENPVAGSDIGDRSAPALGDLDGDGDLDLVVGEKYGDLLYFRNIGSSMGPDFVQVADGGNPFFGIDVFFDSIPDLVDLDADGDLDAVVGERGGALYTFENIGSAAAPLFVEASGSSNPFAGIYANIRSSPALVDLDGDGDLDAVVGDDHGHVMYVANSGSPSSPVFVVMAGAANPFDGLSWGSTVSPALADFDLDGDLDALMGLAYAANTGTSSSPAFTQVSWIGHPFYSCICGGAARSVPEIADLDLDGDLDVLVGTGSGRFIFYRSRARDIFLDDFESGDLTAWSSF